MRILISERQLVSFGQERSLLEVARGLAGRGHEIDLVYQFPGELAGEFEGFCVRAEGVSGFLLLDPNRLRALPHFIKTVRVATRRSHDIVYVNEPSHLPFALVVARKQHLPVVCHLRVRPYPRLHRVPASSVVARVDRFIAVSEHIRSQYVAKGVNRERIDVVLNGIDIGLYRDPGPAVRSETRARLGIPEQAQVFMYAGRLHPEKGVDLLIQAFSSLGFSPEEAKLLIVGSAGGHRDDRDAIEYTRSLRALEGAGSCVWVERTASTLPFYAASDAVVMPSPRQEPFGRVALEAMSCERPILASDVGGFSEILTGWASRFLVRPGDKKALALAMRELMGWRQREPDLGTACRRHVIEEFQLERTVSDIERILSETVANHRHGPRA